MKKVFVKEEETSTGVWPMVYLADLPSHLAHRGVPSDVARNGLFKLIGREGNMLHFKTGTRYATSCSGKVLTSLQTGNEICFVEYRGARIKLDASYYMTGGRKLTQERMDPLRTDDGRTLRQFLADEAAKPLEERL